MQSQTAPEHDTAKAEKLLHDNSELNRVRHKKVTPLQDNQNNNQFTISAYNTPTVTTLTIDGHIHGSTRKK